MVNYGKGDFGVVDNIPAETTTMGIISQNVV